MEAQGVNLTRVRKKTLVSDTKLCDLSMNLILHFFIFLFKKEAGIKILRCPKMERAGKTQRFVPVLVVNQSEPSNLYLC